MPTGWTTPRLDEVADVIYGISDAIAKNRDPKIGPPIIRMANITLDGRLEIDDLRYQAIPKGREEHFLLQPGDLLLNWRSGSARHVGKTAIFNEQGQFTCASFILRIRARPDLVSGRYLRHALNFMRAEGVFQSQTRMQINSKLNAKEFSAFAIRLPSSIQAQEWIADKLDAAESIVWELEREFASCVILRDHLSRAILRKGIAGEL